MSREQFEKLFPVPEGVRFMDCFDGYVSETGDTKGADQCHFRWKGYQSRQPEIDELVNMLNQAFGPDDPLVGWRGAASRADLFRCEFCGAEHLDDSQLEHAPHCLVTKGRALIAKHKGEA